MVGKDVPYKYWKKLFHKHKYCVFFFSNIKHAMDLEKKSNFQEGEAELEEIGAILPLHFCLGAYSWCLLWRWCNKPAHIRLGI